MIRVLQMTTGTLCSHSVPARETASGESRCIFSLSTTRVSFLPSSYHPPTVFFKPGLRNFTRPFFSVLGCNFVNTSWLKPPSLAYVEMRLVLARLLWDFDLELGDNVKKWDDARVFLIWEKNPLWIRLKPVTRTSKAVVSTSQIE